MDGIWRRFRPVLLAVRIEKGSIWGSIYPHSAAITGFGQVSEVPFGSALGSAWGVRRDLSMSNDCGNLSD